MGYMQLMVTVVELETFSTEAERLFTRQEREAIATTVAMNPLSGSAIQGTGGVRKLRFGANQKGKRGGARVIYFYYDNDNPIYLISCYGKNHKENFTSAQKKTFKALTTALKTVFRERTGK